jgi:hypothetical protein
MLFLRPVAKRSELFNEENLASLTGNHPYLLLFQKEDWREYLNLLAQIYDLLEEENVRVPYDVLKSIVVKFYSHRKLQFVENKAISFFNMAIGELEVLRDSHDQFGNRFIETTRAGKELLQLVEGLVAQRTKFSGTGAETLLGALNNILISRERLTESQAIEHHQDKIKAYQQDLQRIKTQGLAAAELLPIPHSNDALFNQAEEAATQILASIEDVKTAIENQRQVLAQSYFERTVSAGHSLNAVADFYQGLYRSPEYLSYNQAKQLLSYLEGIGARFTFKNVDHLLHQIQTRDLVPKENIQRSQIKGFMRQFENADHQIQDKIRSQIRILQQQVHYALHTDVRGVQALLQDFLNLLVKNKKQALGFMEANPAEIEVEAEFDFGPLTLHDLDRPGELEARPVDLHALEEVEKRALFEALLQAEETTLQEILIRFERRLQVSGKLHLSSYPFLNGLAEYYVLSEIDLFALNVRKQLQGFDDLVLPAKSGDFVLRKAPVFLYTIGDKNGLE